MAVDLAQQFTQNINAAEVTLGNTLPRVTSVNALLHELQLGGQLNTSVSQTRRADFSLMLAMLAEDVREQSQFLLPKTSTPSDVIHTDSSLRKQFNLPEKAPLALSSLDDIKQFNQAQFVVDNNFASIQLNNLLRAKPLAFRDNNKFISTEVVNNASLARQLKHKQSQVTQKNDLQEKDNDSMPGADKPLNQALKFNANAWLDGIQECLVKAPLTNSQTH